ncbi:hypothetical protein [Salinimicrobium terrae]|uniref:hypothetical protein n=1 Tax=Salinimicrobium terrae TaxID=470866 RepID=UPI00040334B1|nr:hypothetical protein [Salinimicrobium terrae]
MKNNIGLIVAAIGLLFTICAPTLFDTDLILKYGTLGLGVGITVFGTYKANKERKFGRTKS